MGLTVHTLYGGLVTDHKAFSGVIPMLDQLRRVFVGYDDIWHEIERESNPTGNKVRRP